MSRRDPLLPNAGIVARREYRDRTRSPLFVASTIVLALLAMLVALAPIAVRYLDRQTVTRIAIVRPTRTWRRARCRSPTRCSTSRRPARDAATWKKPFTVEVADDAGGGRADLASGPVGGVMLVQRLPSGQVDVAAADDRGTEQRPEPDPERGRVRDRRPRLERPAAAGRARRPVPPAVLPGGLDQHRDRRGRRARCAPGRQPLLARDRVRHPAPDLDRHLRDVGRDRRRVREEQPGHGADDQRRVAAPDADRQGRRDRGGRVDPVRRDRRAGARCCSPSRTGSRRPSSAPTGSPARRSADCRRPCCSVTASSSCSGSRCSR